MRDLSSDGDTKEPFADPLGLDAHACTIVCTEVGVTGNITYAAEAGAELGLLSCNALPALALAQEMVLEAALLNKFLASTAFQIEREKTTNTSREKTTGR